MNQQTTVKTIKARCLERDPKSEIFNGPHDRKMKRRFHYARMGGDYEPEYMLLESSEVMGKRYFDVYLFVLELSGKRYSLVSINENGGFHTIEEARQALDLAARKRWGYVTG